MTGSADGLVRAAGEGEAAGARLESQYGRVGTSMAGVSAASREHIGGTSVAQAGLLEQGVGKIDNAIKGAIGSVVSMGVQFAGLAAVAGAAGAVDLGIKDAVTFQQSLTMIATQAGDTTDNLKQLGDSLDALGPKVGQTPDQLAQGFFHLASAGYVGTQALTMLQQAAELADVGQSNLETTTNLLVATMKSGVPGIQSASDAVGVLNAIVGSGNMHMQDLVDAMGSGLLPVAGTFGVSIQSVGAAMAFLTDQGVPATDAATKLRMSLSLLAAPSSQATKLLTDAGLASQDAADQTSAMQQAFEKAHVTTTQMASDLKQPDGLVVALTDLKQHMVDAGVSAQEQDAVISRAFGGGRSGAAIIDMYNNLAGVKTKFDEINTSAGNFPADWAQQQKTGAQALQDVKSAADVALTALGTGLLPYIEQLGQWVADHSPQIEAFGKTVGQDLGNAAHAAGQFIANDLFPAIKDVGDFIGQHISTIERFGEVIGALYVEHKAQSLVGGIVSDVQNLLGLAGRVTGSAGAGLPVQHVWVDNPGFGGGGPVGAAGAAEAEAGGAAGMAAIAPMSGIAPGIAFAATSQYLTQSLQNLGISGTLSQMMQNLQQDFAKGHQFINADLGQIELELVAAGNRSGDAADEARVIASLYQQHRIQTGADLQQVINDWNSGVHSSDALALDLDVAHSNLNPAPGHASALDQHLSGAAGSASGLEGALQTLAGLLGGDIGAAQSLMNAIHSDTGAISGVPLPPAYGGAYATGGTVPAAATGGTYSGLISAGEHGPELAILPDGFRGRVPAGTQVLPNRGMLGFDLGARSGGAGGGGGDVYINTVQVNLNGVTDPAAVFEAVQKEAIRRGGQQGQINFGAFR